MFELVEPRVRRVVAEHLGVNPEELTRDVSLTDDLAADSLDLLEDEPRVDDDALRREHLGPRQPERLERGQAREERAEACRQGQGTACQPIEAQGGVRAMLRTILLASAAIAITACQCGGVAMLITSKSLRSMTRRERE